MAIISPGGQVYDRTTGSWAGANQTTVGNGLSEKSRDLELKVWRDAEGITGLQLLKPTTGSGGGKAGSGPGNAGASAGGAGAGGTGPGAPGYVWWEEVGQESPLKGSRVSVSNLPMLEPVMKGENTPFMIGGVVFVPHPGTSNAEEIEELLGDGDSPLEVAWYFKQAAALSHVGHNLGALSGPGNMGRAMRAGIQEWLSGVLTATPEDQLPDPNQYRPASEW